MPGDMENRRRQSMLSGIFHFLKSNSYRRTFSDSLDKYFKLGNNLNQRDVIAVRKTVSGLVKLLYPNGEYSKEIEEV